MKYSYIPVIVILICAYADAQHCTKVLGSILGNKLDQIETGHVEIRLKNFDTRENRVSVTYTQSYKGLPEIGLSLIYIMGYQQNPGIDFSLWPSAGAKYMEVVFSISLDAYWIVAHVHYIISGRPQFTVGNVFLDDPKLSQPIPGSETIIMTKLFRVNRDNIVRSYTAFASISGLNSSENTFNLNITKAFLANNNLTIVFTVEKKLLPLSGRITFFGYEKNSIIEILSFPPEDSYFDRMISSKSSNQTSKNSNPDATTDYSIVGLAGYFGQKLQGQKEAIANIAKAAKSGGLRRLLADQNLNIQMVFNSNISEDERRRIYLRIASGGYNAEQLESIKPKFKKVYIEIFSTKGYGQIVNTASLPARFYRATNVEQSPSSITQILSQDICVDIATCSQYNGKLHTSNDQVQCFLCSAFKQFNLLTEKCECKQGLMKFGDDCIPKKEICDSARNLEYSMQENRCMCKMGYDQRFNEAGNLICTPSCPGNTHLENGRCVGCKRFSSWDSVSQKCVCIPNSKTAPNGDCQPCSPFATYDPVKNECFCNSGYKGMGIVCRPA